MGIIQKQSARSSIFIFLGFIIGAVNLIILFPRFFSQNEIGLTRAMIDIALTLSVLCSLGTVPVIYKFSPFYKDYLKQKESDLPLITGVICLLGFLIVWVCGHVFQDFIIRKLGKSPDFAKYFYTIYPYTLLLLSFMWLEAFAWSIRQTVITNLLKEVVLRVIVTILIFLYGFKIITIGQFINLFSFSYLLPVLVLFLTLIRSRQWSFRFLMPSRVTKRLLKRMAAFSLYIIGAQSLNVIARTNDTILTVGLRGLADAGIFSIALYIVTIMEVPQRSMMGISIAILSESWKARNLDNISNIYRKSVANLLVIALGMFGLIWLNVHSLTLFLNMLNIKSGGNFSEIEKIVLIMGIAKIIDLGTGINSQIIATSNLWRFDFFTNILLTIVAIPLNIILIKAFGLTGLAISNLIALTIFNGVRYFFLWKKYNMQPYTSANLLILSITVLIYAVVYNIPRNGNLYLDTIIRSVSFVILFAPAVYFTKASPDVTNMALKQIKRFTK